jgi:transcriptional regulator with XRE-family HTH domain
MTRLAHKLLWLRSYYGMSVQQVAEQAGITPTFYRQYEAGEKTPTWRAIQGLAEALHADPDLFANLAGVVPDDIALALRESPQRVKDVRKFLGLTAATR